MRQAKKSARFTGILGCALVLVLRNHISFLSPEGEEHAPILPPVVPRRQPRLARHQGFRSFVRLIKPFMFKSSMVLGPDFEQK